MKRFFELSRTNVGLIGALCCIIPSIVLFAIAVLAGPFREVYILRLALCCSVGAVIAAKINVAGLEAWQDKLRWSKGRTTVVDGIVIGSLVGLGICMLPPLTLLIAARSLPDALLFISIVWLAGLFAGGLLGGLIASEEIKDIDPGAYSSV